VLERPNPPDFIVGWETERVADPLRGPLFIVAVSFCDLLPLDRSSLDSISILMAPFC